MDFLNSEKLKDNLRVNTVKEQQVHLEQKTGYVRDEMGSMLGEVNKQKQEKSNLLVQKADDMLVQEYGLMSSMASFAERHRAVDDMLNADLGSFVTEILQQDNILGTLGDGSRSAEFRQLKQASTNFGLTAQEYRNAKEGYKNRDPWEVWDLIKGERESLMNNAFEMRKAAETYLETHNKTFTFTKSGRKRKEAARKLLKLAGMAADTAGYEGTYEWPDQLEINIEKGRGGDDPAPSYKELAGQRFMKNGVNETYTEIDAKAHLSFAYRMEEVEKLNPVKSTIIKTLHLNSNTALAREYVFYAKPVQLDDDGKVIPSLPNLKNFEYNVKLAKGMSSFNNHGYFLGTVIDDYMKDFPEELRNRIKTERQAYLSNEENWTDYKLDKKGNKILDKNGEPEIVKHGEAVVWSNMQEHVLAMLPEDLQAKINKETMRKRREAYKDGIKLQIDKVMNIPFHPDMLNDDVFYKYYGRIQALIKTNGTINNWHGEKIGDENGVNLLKEVLDELGIRNQFVAKLKSVSYCDFAFNYMMNKHGVAEGQNIIAKDKKISELLSEMCGPKYKTEGIYDEDRRGENFIGDVAHRFDPVILEEDFYDKISNSEGANKYLISKLAKDYHALAKEMEEKLAPLLAKRDKLIAENGEENLENNKNYKSLQRSIEEKSVIDITTCIPGARAGWILLDKEVKWVINQLAAQYKQKSVKGKEDLNIAPMTEEEDTWCRENENELHSKYKDYFNNNQKG